MKALYEFTDNQANFLKNLIKKVGPQGMPREDAKQFIAEGDIVLIQLNKPIHPKGKRDEEKLKEVIE